MVNKPRGPGRPRGRPDTRGVVLAAARERFLRDGYAATSVRAIARDAGVDHAVVNYHFGSKEGLFKEVVHLAISPPQVIDAVLAADGRLTAERVLRTLVGIWDRPEYARQVQVLLAELGTDAEVTTAFREYVEAEVLTRVGGQFPGREARQRAAAVGVVVLGLVFARYVVRLEPLASMSVDDLVRYVGPSLAAALGPAARNP